MSRSPFFFVERYNFQTGKYELQHPYVWSYNHDKLIPADLFPYNGCHDLFSIVEDRSHDFPEMKGIHYGLPKDVCQEIADEYKECCYDAYSPKVRWFTYADMYIYSIEYPLVKDYEATEAAWINSEDDEDEISIQPYEQMMNNPIETLKERVDAFLKVVNDFGYENDFSMIRIVYWIE